MAKHLPTMQETWVLSTWVLSLGRGDLLEEGKEPTTVLLPGKSHGWRSLVGYSPRDRKESVTTERLHFLFFFISYLFYIYQGRFEARYWDTHSLLLLTVSLIKCQYIL